MLPEALGSTKNICYPSSTTENGKVLYTLLVGFTLLYFGYSMVNGRNEIII